MTYDEAVGIEQEISQNADILAFVGATNCFEYCVYYQLQDDTGVYRFDTVQQYQNSWVFDAVGDSVNAETCG